MIKTCGGLTIGCVLAVFLSSAGPVRAETSRADEMAALQSVRASHLAATGRCAEAMAIALAAPSRDAETELLIGKCAIQAQDYASAASALERAGEKDRFLVGVNLYRGIALYHLEDYSAARAALAGARAEGEEVALLEFYNGLLLMRDDKPRESALAFERAAARGPDLVEPAASYYAALAWQSLDENEPLNSAVDRVAEDDPGGPWALEAERLIELQAERHRGGQTGLQRWASLKVGAEYDSNVVLRGTEVNLPAGLSSDNDWRGIWFLVLGAELFERDLWTGGVMLSYTGDAHDDLSLLDQHYVTATGWLDREIRPTTLGRLRLDVGYGWIDEDPYLINVDLTALLEERWGRWGTTLCSLGGQFDDFRYDLEFEVAGTLYNDEVDQDGIGLLVGCGHQLPIAMAERFEPTLYAGYVFSSYFAKGIEWDHLAHAIHLGVRVALPLKIDLDVRGTYTRRDFRDASFFAVLEEGEESQVGPDRNDDSFQADVELSRELNDWIEISGRYQYLDNGSSAAAFDYERHIAGAYVELKFP
ncbi:MAG: hypothetical protein JRG89_15475 [Deltaproteobacteria bacterium]|nr:hypothetical protein [Deltaproteobacteria bacterium]MBW2724534.1 hypothetical protein [Deltaproteobacteria bacterium]